MNIDQLTASLRVDEGFKSTVYKDSKGFWTIGDGICVDPAVPGAGLTPDEGSYLLLHRLQPIIYRLDVLIPGWQKINDARQNVLLEMAYQMGVDGLCGFTEMLTCINHGDYAGAADQMLNSEWAKETPLRAEKLAGIMRNGQFPANT